MSDNVTPLFKRPYLQRTAPKRGAANFYRSSGPGAAVGGVPLDSVEAAVVAAVRMGYKVAAAQLDRTERLARRLRQAGDEVAGAGSDRQALDATEQLVFRTMMSGLSWLEGVAGDRSNPLKRFFTAEYRIFGSLLGLTPADEAKIRRGSRRPHRAEEQGPAQPAEAPPVPAPVERPARVQPLIKHQGKERRAVEVRQWQLTTTSSAFRKYPLTFYSAAPTDITIDGTLSVTDKGAPLLAVETLQSAPSGVWKAAICDEQDMQVGYVEIVL